MPLIIPIDSTPSQTFSTTIGGKTYGFDAHWNARDAAWFMSVFEEDGTPIIQGAKLVLNAFIGRRSPHQLFSDGAFSLADLSGQGLDAGQDDLGTRVVLTYHTTEEIWRLRQASRSAP